MTTPTAPRPGAQEAEGAFRDALAETRRRVKTGRGRAALAEAVRGLNVSEDVANDLLARYRAGEFRAAPPPERGTEGGPAKE